MSIYRILELKRKCGSQLLVAQTIGESLGHQCTGEFILKAIIPTQADIIVGIIATTRCTGTSTRGFQGTEYTGSDQGTIARTRDFV